MWKAQSQLPLIDRIKTLKRTITITNKCNSEFNKEKISKEEENKKIETILKDSYKKDSLIYEVAKGEKSYAKLFEPVIEKWNSLWDIIFSKRDDKFDKEATKLAQSMKNVGYVMPDLRTKNIIKEMKESTKISLVYSAGAIGFASAVLGASYLVAPDMKSDLIEKTKQVSLYLAVGIPAASVLFYSITKFMQAYSIKSSINCVKENIKKVDESLRRQYVKYVK